MRIEATREWAQLGRQATLAGLTAVWLGHPWMGYGVLVSGLTLWALGIVLGEDERKKR